MPKKKLPKVLYVIKEEDGGEEYFLAYEELQKLTDMDGVAVGVYELRETKMCAVKPALVELA